MKIENGRFVKLITDVDPRAADLPTEEILALRAALSREGMSLISFLYIFPQGVGVLLPEDVESRLMNPKHVKILDGVIMALKNQIEMLEDLRKGKRTTDGQSTSISNPAEGLRGKGEPV